MKSENISKVGTSPHASKSFFDLDFSGDNFAIVFGTESTSLSANKSSMMDEMVKILVNDDLGFMTLSVATLIVIYEILRQQKKYN